MSGRYTIVSSADRIEKEFNARFDYHYGPRVNAYPGRELPVISSLDPDMITLYRWGLIPYWARDSALGERNFNARSETIFTAGSFKIPVMKRRCLVIANGFFEWKNTPGGKIPYLVYCLDQELFAFAGIWDTWLNQDNDRIYHTFSLITVPSNPRLSFIHNRMPVILSKRQRKRWLDITASKQSVKRMMGTYAEESVNAYPVAREINDPDHDSLQLLEPRGYKLAEDNFDYKQFLVD